MRPGRFISILVCLSMLGSGLAPAAAADCCCKDKRHASGLFQLASVEEPPSCCAKPKKITHSCCKPVKQVKRSCCQLPFASGAQNERPSPEPTPAPTGKAFNCACAACPHGKNVTVAAVSNVCSSKTLPATEVLDNTGSRLTLSLAIAVPAFGRVDGRARSAPADVLSRTCTLLI